MGVEAVHELAGITVGARAARGVRFEGVAQHGQRLDVLEAHGPRF